MADTPFATTDDVAARWRTLTDAEETVAETLLDDASDMIRERWTDVDTRLESGALRASSLRRIVALMVKRALKAVDADGLASQAQSAGPFQVNNTFANPEGNLFLRAQDIALLDGSARGRAFGVDLSANRLPDGYYC